MLVIVIFYCQNLMQRAVINTDFFLKKVLLKKHGLKAFDFT